MKIITGLMFFVLLGIHTYGQDDQAKKAAQDEKTAKVIAEVAASRDRMVKNQPFTADAVSESVQVLGDGNRIVRSTTTKMYRNSEGRFRSELGGGAAGVFGSYYTLSSGVSILDPIAGSRYTLDEAARTARVAQIASGTNISIAGAAPVAGFSGRLSTARALSAEDKAKVEAEVATVTKAAKDLRESAPLAVISGSGSNVYSTAVGGMGGSFVYTTGESSKYETKTEELGTRDFEGVSAEGTKRTTTIPAGAIGNERPIEIVYERWYSKDFGLVMYSKHSDPRFGDQTYKISNLIRTEPDPSLFTVPMGYKLVTVPSSNVYRVTAKPRVVSVRSSPTPAKPATPPAAPRPARP